MYAVRWAAIAGMLLPVELESQPQQLCGRVVSIDCARPSGSAYVHGSYGPQYAVGSPDPPEYRAAFGDDIETRYEVRSVCVTPRAVRDQKAVVHAPEDLVITAEPLA